MYPKSEIRVLTAKLVMYQPVFRIHYEDSFLVFCVERRGLVVGVLEDSSSESIETPR